MATVNRKRDKEGKFAFEGKKSPRLVEQVNPPLNVEESSSKMVEVDSLYEKFQNMSEFEPEVYDDLNNYDIDLYAVPKKVTNDTAVEVLEMIEEARGNYRNSRHRPGSRDYDPGDCEGLLADAFEKLGYDPQEAYSRGVRLLDDVSWEPEYYFHDDLYK